MISAGKDPVILELTATLKEWHQIWISLYLDDQSELFEKIGDILETSIDKRAELIELLQQSPDRSASIHQQINELKKDIVTTLDSGNRLLGLDLVPRDADFKPVDPVELSPIKLYQMHADAAALSASSTSISNTMYGYQEITGSTLSSISQASSDSGSPNNTAHSSTSYHLQLNLKSHYLTLLPLDEVIELHFTVLEVLSTIAPMSYQFRPISEKFLVQLTNDDILTDVSSTIFANLGSINNRDICMLIQAYRIGKMLLGDGKTTFAKQQSSHNLPPIHQDGSNSSLTSAGTIHLNGLARSRHSTIGYFNAPPKYRRPFGTSLILLKDQIKSSNMFKETTISSRIMPVNESDFSQLTDLYTKRNLVMKNNQALPSIQLDLNVKYFSGSRDSLARLIHESPCCLTEKRGFPDVVMPGDFKNDLYLTLVSAEFEKGGKSISKNIEASISLIDKAGIVIDNSISPGSNCNNISCFKSCIFYHSNSPKWNESIKINVPLNEFDRAHIRIEFRHCSTKERDKKFIGFCFLPLSDEDGTVIADNSHELYLYKCDPQIWEDESLNLSKYTNLPYGPHSKVQSNNRLSQQQDFTHSSRELVTVRTFLLSTKLTQNSNLLNLLKWRELIKRNNKDFEEALKKTLVLKGEEIVKFLQDILDTLFDTFTLYSTSEDDISALIFKVLVHIFLLLDEPKYQHFRPVLNTYATAHFSATLVYRGLLACVKKCLDYSNIVERHAPIQKCFKSIKYVFQFIVQSRLLYSKATGEHDEKFLDDLRHLFKLFENLLANSNPKLIPIQVTFLESFPGALEHLVKVLGPQELSMVVISLAGSVGYRLPPDLSKAKLVFMRETASSELLQNQNIRSQIAENFCRHLSNYLKHSEELELCHEVLEILIVQIHDCHWPVILGLYRNTSRANSQEAHVMTVGKINKFAKITQIQANQLDLAIISVTRDLDPFIALMEPLLQLLDMLVKDFNTDRVIIQKYCTCLLTIMKLMGRMSFDEFLKNRRLDYSKQCNLFRSFRAVYNRDWSIMQLTSHSILEQAIDEVSRDIRVRCESSHLNRQLTSCIKLIVDFITHPTLQLESFSEQKKSYVLRVFGDLRLKYGDQLMRFWATLERSTICDLIPTSIQSFLDASLLPNDELQCKLIPVFWDMIDAEHHYKSGSKQLERCFIDNLDLFLNLDRGSQSFLDNFEQILTKMIKERSCVWEQRGLRLIQSLTKLMQLLISYRQSFENFVNRTKQMCCLVDLLSYYKDQDRMDIHLRYLFKLCDMHLDAGNHTEAAFTLKLYTDEIRWSHKNLNQLDGYRPEEPEWHRKEALYQRIIQYFDMGKCWEEALPLCKELSSFYENFLVDYEKLSSTLKKLAQFLDSILTEHRPQREYFRVEFLGTDLPDYVKHKELIYRGGEYERLAAFVQRMSNEFPDIQLIHNKAKQSVTKDSPGQFMVITNVKPVPSLQDHLKPSQRNINDKVIQYYMNNRLDTFSYDVPMVKGGQSNKERSSQSNSGGNDVNVKCLWVGRHILHLKKSLPDILPWCEVVQQEYIEISPINHAIETVSNMNLELSKLILSYRTEPNKQISPLTMRLQGVIEAAVNGGPAVFINAFLKRQPHSDPNDQKLDPELTARLRDLIEQQYSILETGLTLHSKLAPPEVMPLHARLVERLHSTRPPAHAPS